MNFHNVLFLSKIVRYGLFIAIMGAAGTLYAQGEAAAAAEVAPAAQSSSALYYAIAATMCFASRSAAYAVGKIGAAVMGAAAEKPEVLGKAIAFVGLGEGIALFGFLISFFLVMKIGA
ncbi:MAG: ATPase [Oligosphaeraceae bacterium]|nr:ATPase [Oligosphaeraceae bacterium]